MKQCSKCGVKKPLSEFFTRGEANKKHISRSSCKSCCKIRQEEYRNTNRKLVLARQKSWRKRNPEHIRNYYFVSNYGVTAVQRDKIFSSQEGKCAICKTKLKNDKNTHLDHCHTDNEVRGILCTNCNHLLGNAKDSTDVLQSAILYLNKHAKKENR